MKLNFWIAAAMTPLTSVMVLAQQPTSAPATGAPAPAAESTPATPSAPTIKSSLFKNRAILNPPAVAAVKNANLNVRGQPSFIGETLGHLKKGDTVTVTEQITLRHPAKDEPVEWDQILLPAGIPVWVDGMYVDTAAGTIKARRVNLRGGPGENFSTLGRLEKGAAVKVLKSEKGWVAIEAPSNTVAYVAAGYLEFQPAVAATPTTPAPPAETPAATPAAPVATVPIPTPAPAPTATAPQNQAAATPTAPAPTPVEPAAQKAPDEKTPDAVPRTPATEPAPAAAGTSAPSAPPLDTSAARVITREGFVKRVYSLQAPASFQLTDIQSGTTIDFLQPAKGMNFKVYVGTRVSVTGTEFMDEHYPRTPVLNVQTVELIP